MTSSLVSTSSTHGCAVLIPTLSKLLIDDGFCSSYEEAMGLAECIVLNDHNQEDDTEETTTDEDSTYDVIWEDVRERLIDYVDADNDQADQILRHLMQRLGLVDPTQNNADNESDDDNNNSDGYTDQSDNNDNNDDDDSTELLLEGECELCERDIKLTRHHLIPKSTWTKIEPKLLRSVVAIQDDGDAEKATLIAGEGLIDVVHDLSLLMQNPKLDQKTALHMILRRTCDICRNCHSFIHRVHTNMDLAVSYNSIERLISDPQIRKFCKWQNKQRPGQYSRR